MTSSIGLAYQAALSRHVRCLLLIVLVMGLGSSVRGQDDGTRPVRALAEIHTELRQLERGMAQAKTDQEKSRNTTALCRLFIEIGEHPSLPKSATLQRLSVRLRARLANLEQRIADQMRRRKIAQPQAMVDEEVALRQARARRADLGSARVAAHNSVVQNNLATHSSAATPRGSGFGHSGDNGGVQDRVADGDARFGPGGLPDYGWALIGLIRKTIRPDYWDTAGGVGKAIYFGQARALVIHGSWRIQEDVAELLEALRGG